MFRVISEKFPNSRMLFLGSLHNRFRCVLGELGRFLEGNGFREPVPGWRVIGFVPVWTEPFLGTVFLERGVLRRFRVPEIPFPRFRKSLCFEGILLYFERIFLYFESLILCFESIFLYVESIHLYVETILLRFESALLDVESILLYFATMLGQRKNGN